MLFNQQQCFIYSTASFLSKLRAKEGRKPAYFCRHKTASTNDGLPEISKMKYRNRERLFPVLPKVKKKVMQTDPRFF
jgi:TATA-binding protein-associated factor Taf7